MVLILFLENDTLKTQGTFLYLFNTIQLKSTVYDTILLLRKNFHVKLTEEFYLIFGQSLADVSSGLINVGWIELLKNVSLACSTVIRHLRASIEGL